MAKLLTTKEVFQVSSRVEAENMFRDFGKATFPMLLGYHITEENGDIILTVEKEFGVEFDKMKFDQVKFKFGEQLISKESQ